MTRTFLALALLSACSGATDSDTETDTEAEVDTEADTEADSDTEAVPGAIEIIFTAFMADNDGDIQDEAGDYDDWLTIENTGTETVDLTDWQLTDDYPEDLTPWTFPSGQTIAPGEELLIWCDEDDDGPLHASFKLSAGGETVTLLNVAGDVVDEVTFPEMGTDEAYVLQDDGTWALE